MGEWYPWANLAMTTVAVVMVATMTLRVLAEAEAGNNPWAARSFIGCVTLFFAAASLMLPALSGVGWLPTDAGRIGVGLSRGVVIVGAYLYLRATPK